MFPRRLVPGMPARPLTPERPRPHTPRFAPPGRPGGLLRRQRAWGRARCQGPVGGFAGGLVRSAGVGLASRRERPSMPNGTECLRWRSPGGATAMESPSPSLAELLEGHTVLDVECFDRIYCNVYQPKLQTPGGVVYFLHDHRGNPIPSPALFRPMGDAYRKAVAAFAEDSGIEMITFPAGERKIDVATSYLQKMSQPGVAVIGKAQEIQRVVMGTDVARDPDTGCPHYSFKKVERRVTVYYFYALDEEWGPTFLKMCAYFPYPAKLWCNGHEWVKRQLEKKGVGYVPLATRFAAADDARALRRTCSQLGPRQLQDLFERSMERIPLPLGPRDFEAGYQWEASMNQIEFSRTLILDRPARARAFFDRVVECSTTLGRPSEVEVIFGRRVQKNTPGLFRTVIMHEGVEPRVSVYYKGSREKRYLKEGRAPRLEP